MRKLLLLLVILMAPHSASAFPACAGGKEPAACRKEVMAAFEKLQGNMPAKPEEFLNACRSGDAFACSVAAGFAKSGWIGNPEKPDEFLSRAILEKLYDECNKKNRYSCYGLGHSFENGIEVAQDYRKGLSYHLQSCELGLFEACNQAGRMYYKAQGVKQDFNKALLLTKKSCDGGSGKGCQSLGFAILEGKGAVKSKDVALKQFEKSCEMGAGNGCSSVGWMHENGYGTTASRDKAIEFYRKACDLGSGQGCMNLGTKLAPSGANIHPDSYKELKRIFGQACQMGNGEGCLKEATAQEKILGTKAAASTMARLTRRACFLGAADGCKKLAEYYQKGFGVPKSADQAKRFLAMSKSKDMVHSLPSGSLD